MPIILKIKNLTKSFNSFNAVNDVSFEAQTGEILGLLGPNGAGKTTTIRIISTILSPTSGTAEVYGFDIRKNSIEVRKNLGMLTTDIGVYERFSGRENLRYFGELYGVRGEKLESRINELSELLKMQDFIDRRAGKYSTGMKQKLAIARAVIHNPKIIIFDEPTAGLDVLASQTVLSFMQKSRDSGKLVIFSTHRMNEAEKLCDRAVIIHRGKIIADGTIDSLRAKTNASNLEDAFMKLIEEKNLNGKMEIKPEEKSDLRQTSLSKGTILLLLAMLFFLLSFALNFLPGLLTYKEFAKYFTIAGFILLAAGRILSIKNKR